MLQHAEGRLLGGERVIARFQIDLNISLHFHPGLIVLTNRRLLHVERAQAGKVDFRAWKLAEIEDVVLEEMGATAAIYLIQAGVSAFSWRTTSGRVREAEAFLAHFKEQRRTILNVEPRSETNAVTDEEDDLFESDQAQSTGPRGSPLIRLFKFARPWRRLIAIGFGLTIVATGAGLIGPYLTMKLLDDVLIPLQTLIPSHSQTAQKHIQLVYLYVGGLAGAAILAWVLNWGKTFTLARISERVSSQLRRVTFEHLQRLSLTYFSKKRTGDLISRIGSDTDRICSFISVNFIDFVCDVLTILFTAVILFTINPLLAFAALGPLPIVGWLVQRVRGHLRGGFAAASRAWSQMISVLADTIPGVRVVKAFAQEQREMERFRIADRHVFEANDRVNRTWSFFTPMMELLTDFGLLVVWGVGAWSVAHEHMTVGILTGFLQYISRFYGRFDSMSRFIAQVQRASASAHRIFEVLDVKPDVPVQDGARKIGRLRGEIEFRNVKFRYGSRQVIRGISLKIAPGEMIGLVGPSGAGKTTLVNLACRFFDVSEGAVLVDGVDLREIDVIDYRRNLGLVLQEPYLFYGTISENIAYGKPDATRAEIIATARAARAHDFIMKLPDAYDSMVGERGSQLSGGERQRISIARALLIDPAVLILDEATSSVDTETEREIQEALDHLVKGRTTIAIAHRLGTLRRASRLVVIEDGGISEIGAHDELLKRSGTYSRLYHAMTEVAHP